MAKKTKETATDVAPAPDTQSIITDGFDRFRTYAMATMEDYVSDPKMMDGIASGIDNLQELVTAGVQNLSIQVVGLKRKSDSAELEQRIEKLNEALTQAEDECNEMQDKVKAQEQSIQELQNRIGELEEFEDQKGDGWVSVRITNPNHRDMLEAFIKSAIYPGYNDQESFVRM